VVTAYNLYRGILLRDFFPHAVTTFRKADVMESHSHAGMGIPKIEVSAAAVVRVVSVDENDVRLALQVVKYGITDGWIMAVTLEMPDLFGMRESIRKQVYCHYSHSCM
jgi:hypothetical protein